MHRRLAIRRHPVLLSIQAAVLLAVLREGPLLEPPSVQSAAMRGAVRQLAPPWAALPAQPAGAPQAEGLTTIEFPHYQNFIDAIRANDPKILTCDILEGHLSAALVHMANASYLVGHSLEFDGKTEQFKGNEKKANELLTRQYRKGFEVPSSFAAQAPVASRKG